MGLWSAGMGSSSGRDNFLFPLVYFLEKHNKTTTTTISCPQLQSVMNSGWNASCIHLCFPSCAISSSKLLQLLIAQRQQTEADVLLELLPDADGYFGAAAC